MPGGTLGAREDARGRGAVGWQVAAGAGIPGVDRAWVGCGALAGIAGARGTAGGRAGGGAGARGGGGREGAGAPEGEQLLEAAEEAPEGQGGQEAHRQGLDGLERGGGAGPGRRIHAE